MKNTIIAVMLAWMSLEGVNAQDTSWVNRNDQAWVRPDIGSLTQELDMNDLQQRNMHAVVERFEKKYDAMLAMVPGPTAREAADNAVTLMKERDTAMEDLLTAEQNALWKTQRQKAAAAERRSVKVNWTK